jgi:hypothetical protein
MRKFFQDEEREKFNSPVRYAGPPGQAGFIGLKSSITKILGELAIFDWNKGTDK